MSSTYRSAMGKPVDMAKIRSKNEGVRAVGNMNVNARGDTIDNTNKVVGQAGQRVNAVYNKASTNPTALPKTRVQTSNHQLPEKQTIQPVIEEISSHEAELFDELDSEEIIKPEAKSKKK